MIEINEWFFLAYMLLFVFTSFFVMYIVGYTIPKLLSKKKKLSVLWVIFFVITFPIFCIYTIMFPVIYNLMNILLLVSFCIVSLSLALLSKDSSVINQYKDIIFPKYFNIIYPIAILVGFLYVGHYLVYFYNLNPIGKYFFYIVMGFMVISLVRKLIQKKEITNTNDE